MPEITAGLSPVCFGDLKGSKMCLAAVIPPTQSVRGESDGSGCYSGRDDLKDCRRRTTPTLFILLTLSSLRMTVDLRYLTMYFLSLIKQSTDVSTHWFTFCV